jgi:hypothetical protein
MRGKHPCRGCVRLTRGTVRFPMVGESYRVPACSRCKQAVCEALEPLATSPEFRLLAAIAGGVDRMEHKP